jgi:hypothetical protein
MCFARLKNIKSLTSKNSGTLIVTTSLFIIFIFKSCSPLINPIWAPESYAKYFLKVDLTYSRPAFCHKSDSNLVFPGDLNSFSEEVKYAVEFF